MKKKFAIVGDGCVLPDAIVEDILSRLHSKIFMKLRIVCKKWKTLISTCYFKRLHNEKSLKNPNLLLLPQYSSSRGYVLTTVSLTGEVLDQWDLPLLSRQNVYMLPSQWGPNNLVCFILNLKRFVVCNPSVRKIIHLPQQPHSKIVDAYGFCYLPSMNKYVIISVGGNKWQMIAFSNSNNFKDLRWKPIKDKTPCKVYRPDGVFVNGVMFWTGFAHSWSRHLLCFDLYEEKFFNVVYPDEINDSFQTLHELNGDLHLLPWLNGTLRTLWKLDDARNQIWIKQYTIYIPGFFLPLMVGEDGEMLVYHEFLEWLGLQDEVFRIRRKGVKEFGHLRYIRNIKLHTDTFLMS